ncbi:MAG: hypothetical protein AAF367_02300 [Pseudomonadota bacterium]
MTVSYHFIGLSRDAISRIARDPSEPILRRHAARRYLVADTKATAATAREAFERATQKFEKLAQRIGRPLPPAGKIPEKTAKPPSTTKPIAPAEDASPSDPSPPVDPAPVPQLPSMDAKAAPVVSRKFADLGREYLSSWQVAVLDEARMAVIDAACARLMQSAGRYRSLERLIGVPWYVAGAIHGLEASFDFTSHLHNGDPLTARTRRVPRGRPAHGSAPFTWEESAEDALRGHGLDKVADWTLDRILYEFERYNGFGYRYRQTHSPYLWSGSSRYVSGKYVRDGVFDPAAVSKQIGAAVLLKRMVQTGDIAGFPPGAVS